MEGLLSETLLHKKLAVIQDISKALSASLDLETLLSLIMRKVTELMSASRSTLFLLSDDRNHLWSKVLQGDELVEIRLKTGQGVAGWVAESGESVNIVDAYSDLRFDKHVDKESGFKTETILCVPMRDSLGDTIGVLQLLNKKGGPFTEEDEELLDALSSQAAMAIENSKLYHSVVSKNKELADAKEDLKKRNGELDLLFRLERSLGAKHSRQELFEALFSLTTKELGASHCMVVQFKGEKQEALNCMVEGEEGLEVKLDLESHVALKDGLLSMEPKRLGNLDFTLPSQLFKTVHPIGVKNGLLTPIDCKEEKTIYWVLLNKTTNGKSVEFTEVDTRIVTMIAGQVGHALDALLERKEKEEEDRLAVIGQMLAGVVHDLKTPMTIISGYTQLMAGEESAEKRNEYEEEIMGQFDMLSGMTGSVLAFARGESEQFISKVYLDKFFKKLDRQLKTALQGKSIELKTQYDFKGVVYIDELNILRLIHNLIRNAEQAMGGSGNIELASTLEDGKWNFVCKDDGPGIPEELRSTVFERFASGKEDGTGLGLAICKKVCENHQGSIGCEAGESGGALFRFILPISEEMSRKKISIKSKMGKIG